MSAAKVCDKTFIHCEPADRWTRIGRLDDAGRRSTWARIETIEGPPEFKSFGGFSWFEEMDPIAVELCGGREGDDAYVRVERDNPAFWALLDVVRYAIGNIDDEEEDEEQAAKVAHEAEMADQEAQYLRGEIGPEEVDDPKFLLQHLTSPGAGEDPR